MAKTQLTFDPNPLCFEMIKIFEENRGKLFWDEGLKKGIKKKVVIYNEGGSRCFGGEQKIITENGSKPISELKKGDIVLTYNEVTKVNEYKKVNKSIPSINSKKTLKIILRNGESIIVTDDHKFFYEGRWISIKHLLSLRDEKITNNKR